MEPTQEVISWWGLFPDNIGSYSVIVLLKFVVHVNTNSFRCIPGVVGALMARTVTFYGTSPYS
jgi:hypothetical protein